MPRFWERLSVYMPDERQRYRFLKFDLVADPNMGSGTLPLTGPVDKKEFLTKLVKSIS
jgi:hypothetical protein